MATASNANSDSPSIADRLETVGRVVWVGFLLSIVVFTLIPVVGLLLGTAPFDPPNPTPYLAFVGLAVVGTAVIIGVAIYDA